MSNAPAKRFRIGYVTVTIWRNDGTERPFYTVEVQRTYKDDNGELRNTSSLNHADVLVAAHLLTLANAWILEH